MARQYRCDVPGCARTRPRWMRICESCWPQLPGDIRRAITENFRIAARAVQGSNAKREAARAHRDACKAARAHLDAADAANRRAYANNARMLGEREEADEAEARLPPRRDAA